MTKLITLYYDEQDTPIGILTLLGDGEHVLRIDYGSIKDLEEKWQKWTKRYFGDVIFVHNPTVFIEPKNEISAYFYGDKKTFTFSYKLYRTDFQKQAWRALVDRISFGEMKTYKDLAELIGNTTAIRDVGSDVN